MTRYHGWAPWRVEDAEDQEGGLRIDCAAIRLAEGIVVTMPRPARHHTIIHVMTGLGFRQPHADEQGFMLNDGRFAWRRPALNIARRAGQLIREPTAPAHGLFSEDVW